MEETDLPPSRLEATRTAMRAFAATRKGDRIGVAIYAQQPKLVLAPTADLRAVDETLAAFQIGDVEALGTAMGDGLALAVEQLGTVTTPRAIILTTDGDTNWVTRYDPKQAAELAKAAGIVVHTVLVGNVETETFGGMSVNPAVVKAVAETTGGLHFHATEPGSFQRGLQDISARLDKLGTGSR
jgi:Ca-activated chloride channel family protein